MDGSVVDVDRGNAVEWRMILGAVAGAEDAGVQVKPSDDDGDDHGDTRIV